MERSNCEVDVIVCVAEKKSKEKKNDEARNKRRNLITFLIAVSTRISLVYYTQFGQIFIFCVATLTPRWTHIPEKRGT